MSLSWISKLFQKPTRPIKRSTPAAIRAKTLSFRPGVEGLEDRVVPAFLTPTSYAAGINPAGIAVGDFNGDGRADMAVVNQTAPASVSILISNGDGTFQPKIDFAAGAYAVDAKAGDFNGDGKMDLAIVGTQATVSILLGNGDGTFGMPTTYAVASGSHSLNVGDFNNDGKLDVATMNAGSASVLLGNGDGTLQPSISSYIPGNSTNTVVGDFNRDGNLDLATSNTVSIGTVTILRGHGDGTFDPAASYYAYSAPVYLAAGDFNHDGYDDLAVTNSYSASSMSVMLNNGDGTYAAPRTYGITETGYEIEVADFNNDGNQDFAVRGGNTYMVELGKGDGTFYSSIDYATPSGRFQAGTTGDFNGDGAVDFAYPSAAGVTVVMNSSDGIANLAGAVAFKVATPSSTTSGSVLPMTVTAVDADGNTIAGFHGTVYVSSSDPAATWTVAYTFTAADAGVHTFAGPIRLVTAGNQTVTVSAPFMAATTQNVMVTAPVNHFALTTPIASAGNEFNVTVSAVDAAGNVGSGYSSTVHFSSADVQAGLPADYTFTAADAGVHTFATTLRTAGLEWVGVNEVGGTISGGVAVSVSPGAATTFALAGAGGAIGVARPVTIVARDIYGNVDTSYSGVARLTSSDSAAQLPATFNVVNGSASVNVTFMTVGAQTVTAVDVATGTLIGTLSSDATPSVAKLFTVTGSSATTAGAAQNLSVTVHDTIGQIATGYSGTIYFSSSDVQAGLPANYTFTAADAGVHAFSAILRTAGAQAITVRDVTGALIGTQMGIDVSAGAFSSFQLSVPNGRDSKGHVLVAAGDAISLTVRATDAFGNSLIGYRGKVKFTSTDVQAGLPADYNFTVADAGVHTFSVALKTATPNGVVWSFNVTDAANAASLATITNFEVTNAMASSFVVSVPSNVTAGTPFSLKVSVLDAYGNRVKNYFGTIHFANTTGLLGLPADYTFNSVDAGVQSFMVTLNTSGNQTLSVVDTANSSLNSKTAISVKAAATGGGGTVTPPPVVPPVAPPPVAPPVKGGGNTGGGKKPVV